jgi:hypothetical protein
VISVSICWVISCRHPSPFTFYQPEMTVDKKTDLLLTVFPTITKTCRKEIIIKKLLTKKNS